MQSQQLNDTAITRSKGLVGSVMDYSPINIAPKGKKQGDYYSTTIGPYDYWAIEYAYKPVEGDEATELKKIAARAPEHDLVYATDEDAFLNDDPYVNRFDLGGPLSVRQGSDRPGVRAAQGSGRPRGQGRRLVGPDPAAFGILIGQFGDGATLAAQYVGGQSVSRDHKADKAAATRSCRCPGPSSASASSSWPTTSSATRRFSSRRPCCGGWARSGGRTGATTTGAGRASTSRCWSGFWASRRSCWGTARAQGLWPGSRISSFKPIPGPIRSAWRKSSAP